MSCSNELLHKPRRCSSRARRGVAMPRGAIPSIDNAMLSKMDIFRRTLALLAWSPPDRARPLRQPALGPAVVAGPFFSASHTTAHGLSCERTQGALMKRAGLSETSQGTARASPNGTRSILNATEHQDARAESMLIVATAEARAEVGALVTNYLSSPYENRPAVWFCKSAPTFLASSALRLACAVLAWIDRRDSSRRWVFVERTDDRFYAVLTKVGEPLRSL